MKALKIPLITILCLTVLATQVTAAYPPSVYLYDLPATATYTIKTDGTNYWYVRYDGFTYSSTNASYIFSLVLAATTSGKIFVTPGTYTFTNTYLLINGKSNILLEGSGSSSTIFSMSYDYNGVWGNNSQRITLRDFAVTHAGHPLTKWAIEIDGCTDVLVERVRSYDNAESGFRTSSIGNGPSGTRCNTITFLNCVSISNDEDSTTNADGFDIAYSNDVKIIGCNVTRNKNSGIGVYYSKNVEITDNEIGFNVYDGITIRKLVAGNCSYIKVSNNNIHNNTRSGITVGNGTKASWNDGSFAIISNNDIFFNGERGILLYTDSNIIQGNRIYWNKGDNDGDEQGIEVLSGCRNIIQANEISFSQDDGLEIYGVASYNASYNLVYGNIFFNNTDKAFNIYSDYVDHSSIIANVLLTNLGYATGAGNIVEHNQGYP